MKFLNKKEEVINIQLTPYGKFLLSQGKFDPQFYAFYDEGVMYDGQYAGLNYEGQNEIHNRIKEVPQFEVQAIFGGVETEFNKFKQLNIQGTPDKHYSTVESLGNLSLESNTVPGWQLNVLKGQISGSVPYLTGSIPTLRIPQITLKDIEYITKTQQKSAQEFIESISDLNILSNKFSDDSFIEIFEDDAIIELDELNTDILNDNFQIEVFKVENEMQSGNNKEVLTPLSFAKKKKVFVKNNILLDKPIEEQSEVTSENVEYYFNIFTDNDIAEDILCKLKNNDNCLVDSEPKTIEKIDIYKTSVTEEDIKDNC